MSAKPRPTEVVELEARERAKLVYRALRDAGRRGMQRRDLEQRFGWDAMTVLQTIQWLRMQRVDVQVRVGRDVLSWDRGAWFVLAAPLPASWEP